jgi:aldehyde dehydrogenase (NAD+)
MMCTMRAPVLPSQPPLRLPFVDGAAVAPDGRAIAVIADAATGAPFGRVAVGTVDDVDLAVAAAARAFPAWSGLPRAERLDTLERLADELDARGEELARTITAEVGTPIKLSRRVQVGLPRLVLRSTLKLAAELPEEEQLGTSLIVREPIGVVAAITPWNYPLHQAMGKLAPALAVGCTVVLKPASGTPLHALLLADAAAAAGLPAGVLNVVTGSGGTVGEHLVGHPDVDMVTFTGSTEGGRRVAALAAQTVKKVALELGGKSACVILDDADLESAVRAAVRNGLLNSGQTCSAWTRLIVAREQEDQAAEIAAVTAAAMRLGDPTDEATHLGPLISAAQRDSVSAHIVAARVAGLREVYAGTVPDGLGDGAYLAPHIFAGVGPEHALAQEEVFGPVLAIMPAENEDHAVELANSTIYGLAGGVFSGDDDRALRVARRLRTGQVDVNGGAFNPEAPFGGYRQSGTGRELGRFGLEEFLEIKAIQR